jgi:16S rRNA (uracil1498-N3)-methyltransferase
VKTGRAVGVRLFVPRARLLLPRLSFSPDDQRYLLRVRRLKAGDAVEVFDGQGGRYHGVIDPGLISATLGPRQADSRPAGLSLELWPGIPKSDKLDLIIEKATELGVARIVPLAAEHSVPRMATERLPARLERWNRIAAEAARQCGRADVPEVSAPRDFSAFLRRSGEGVAAGVVFEGNSERSVGGFLASLDPETTVVLAIGPEGGFAAGEVDAAVGAGVPLLTLGSRILRTETAAIVACTLVQATSGRFDS